MSNTQRETEIDLGVEERSDNYVDRVLDTQLSSGTLDMLANVLADDWVLGNLDEAEVHEQKWLSRTMQLEVEAQHPHNKSIWQGEVLAYARDHNDPVPGRQDDPRFAEALNGKEETMLRQLVDAHAVRLTRSEAMEQQEIFRTSIQRREQEDTTDEEGWVR